MKGDPQSGASPAGEDGVPPQEARRQSWRDVRLVPEEAARLIATLGIALLVLVPSVFRLLPSSSPPPTASCVDAASRDAITAAIRCDATGIALPGPQAFLVGVPIDVNTADAATLALVPGIGPKLSARIVADREAHGPFGAPVAVQRVKGIGPKLGARLARFSR